MTYDAYKLENPEDAGFYGAPRRDDDRPEKKATVGFATHPHPVLECDDICESCLAEIRGEAIVHGPWRLCERCYVREYTGGGRNGLRTTK